MLIDIMVIKDDPDEYRSFILRYIIAKWESYFAPLVARERERGNPEAAHCYLCALENERLNLIELRYYIPDSFVELIGIDNLLDIVPFWAHRVSIPEEFKYVLEKSL